MQRLLALDQASKTTGYAIFIDGYLHTSGTFTVSDQNLDQRLHKIRTKITELIEDFGINEVAIEDIYMDEKGNNNVSTFKALAEVLGVIQELLVSLKIPYHIVLAGTWKSTIGIKKSNRPQEKKAAKDYVLKTYQIDAKQDACDAICIGSHIIKQKENEINW